ncbi:hypothetical protein GCM10027589_25410 [Actinocorallia lasiicapitis]
MKPPERRIRAGNGRSRSVAAPRRPAAPAHPEPVSVSVYRPLARLRCDYLVLGSVAAVGGVGDWVDWGLAGPLR